MSKESGEKNCSVLETESVSENAVNQPEKKNKWYKCDVCELHVNCKRNFDDHLAGRKHLRKLELLSATSKVSDQASPKLTPKSTKKKTNKKNNLSKKSSKNTTSKTENMNVKEKSQNNQNRTLISVPVSETVNNFPNRSYKYNNRGYENQYERPANNKYRPSNYYKNGRQYYNNKYNWNSDFSQNRNFNYRSRDQFYPQGGYDTSYGNECTFENRHQFFNPFTNYRKNSNSGGFEQNFEYADTNDDGSLENIAVRNPFKSYYSEDAVSPPKSSDEKLGSEPGISNTGEADVSNKSSEFSKDSASASKYVIITKTGNKRIIYRSRSLSSSESDKKGKDKTDQAESEESEEQRIQQWTNSLLETNHNQLTRLINPSNHKEKAAVNHLITKFSKSKRKEILSRTLRTNSSELTDNDDRDLNSEDVSAEVESANTEEEEISDSNIISNLKQNSVDFSTSSTSKADSSKFTNDKQDQSNEDILEFSESSRLCSKKNNNFTSNKSSRKNGSSFKNKTTEKRKSDGSDSKVKKKQKTNSIKNSNALTRTESEDLNKGDSRKTATQKNSCSSSNKKTSEQDTFVTNIKKEYIETDGGIAADISNLSNTELSHITNTDNADLSGITDREKKSQENLVFNPDVSVETLINLFASGTVKVKEEFNDPLMDALKEISPDELMSACSNNSQETVNVATTSSMNRENSKNTSGTPSHNNSINPVILGSAAIETDASLVSITGKTNSVSTCSMNDSVCSSMTVQNEPILSTSSVPSQSVNDSSSCTGNDKSLDNSFLKLNDTKVELPPYLNKLIKQLQDITSEEEKIKGDLIEAKSKINEYASLLEDWKGKKKKLQEQEESLRKERNNIIKLMQDTVKTDSDEIEKESPLSSDNVLSNPSTSKRKDNIEIGAEVDTSRMSPLATSSPNKQRKKTKLLPPSLEADEIIVIPAPQKPQPPEIIICDDEENVGNQAKISRLKISSSVPSDKRSSVYEVKTVDAHTTVINSLVVFEDYLYTCSNDNTAKRFSLKDSSLSATYVHSAKNVTEIVVEKVQNEALVFTSCSARLISLFIASSGTKIKNFFPPCPVMSISKGWGKFYAGLANGSVNMYNWKYEEIEIVKTEQPASRIATADQGRLHVLVILSSEGNIAIRDAETGLLIRYIKINIKHPSWMCLHNDLVYLSSVDKSLIIFDIMSGKIEKKLYMNCHTTGLAVYDDYIFTISYNGVINCYNKDNSCDKKLFYGAGKGGLTCVYIYQNWVFTGNRKGDVSLFHFDPSALAACEFAKCDAVYGLTEDLAYHIEKDHLQKKKMLTQCNWRGCDFKFPRGSDTTDKMNHLRTHIYQMDCTSSSFVN